MAFILSHPLFPYFPFPLSRPVPERGQPALPAALERNLRETWLSGGKTDSGIRP